jgi:hypothetical protein
MICMTILSWILSCVAGTAIVDLDPFWPPCFCGSVLEAFLIGAWFYWLGSSVHKHAVSQCCPFSLVALFHVSILSCLIEHYIFVSETSVYHRALRYLITATNKKWQEMVSFFSLFLFLSFFLLHFDL